MTIAAVAVIALVFELLPKRIDPFYAVLATAGLGSLLGSGLGALSGVPRSQRALYAETGSLLFAAGGLTLFGIGSAIQGVA